MSQCSCMSCAAGNGGTTLCPGGHLPPSYINSVRPRPGRCHSCSSLISRLRLLVWQIHCDMNIFVFFLWPYISGKRITGGATRPLHQMMVYWCSCFTHSSQAVLVGFGWSLCNLVLVFLNSYHSGGRSYPSYLGPWTVEVADRVFWRFHYILLWCL